MNKQQWHRKATALLVKIARELDIPTGERRISSNPGGNAVGGEVTMSAPNFGVYVHLACPINSYGQDYPLSVNYARKATPDDPYGTGFDKPNHVFEYLPERDLVKLLRSLGDN